MDDNTKKVPPIVVDLQPYGEQRTVDTVEQLEAWINAEASGWASLTNVFAKESDSFGQRGAAVVGSRLQNLREFVQQYREQVNSKRVTEDQARTQLVQQIAARFPKGKRSELYIPFGSAAFKMIERLAAEDRQRAGFALITLLRLPWGNHSINHNNIFQGDPSPLFAGLVDAELFRRGIDGREVGEANALAKLRQEWLDELRKHQELYATEVTAARQDIAKRNEAEKAHDERFDKIIADGSKQLADELATRQKQFGNLNETYNRHLALKASVRYWRNRGRWAAGLTVGLFLLILASGGTLVWYLNETVNSIVAASAVAAPASAPAPSAAAAPALPPWYRFWIAPVIFILGAWGIRMLSRLLYANYQASATSYEKATMVESFLALMKDAQGLPPDSIKALLTAVYNPPGASLGGEPMIDPDVTTTAANVARNVRVTG